MRRRSIEAARAEAETQAKPTVGRWTTTIACPCCHKTLTAWIASPGTIALSPPPKRPPGRPRIDRGAPTR